MTILGFQYLRRTRPLKDPCVFQIPQPGLPKKPGSCLWLKNDPNTWIPQTTIKWEFQQKSNRFQQKLQNSQQIPQQWSSPKMPEFRTKIIKVPPSPVRVPVELQPGRLVNSSTPRAAWGRGNSWWHQMEAMVDGRKFWLTTGENILSHGIFLFTAAGAGFCQQPVEIARRYPVLFL